MPSGTIGVGRVVRAAPDGYTVGIGHLGTHVVNGAIYPLPYDLLKDLEPVALLPSNPLLIVTKQDVSGQRLKELIAWLKTNPDKASAGTSGAGGGSHVNGVYFQNLTGTRFQFVPYRGTGPALTDLVAGQIDMMFDQASNSLPQVRAGTIKAYAVTAKERLPPRPISRPSTRPACRDSIHRPGTGCGCPRARRNAVIAKLNAAVVEALADPVVQKRLGDRPRNSAARAADAGGARCSAQGRDREVVADRQGREHQAGMKRARRSAATDHAR